MADPRRAMGATGEQLAEDFLRARGLRPVARQFATPVGELDLVMCDGPTVVFVEVKTRRDRRLADPQDAINTGKRQRMLRAARWFLHARGWEHRPCRCDVVAVILPPDGPPQIEHFPDAFAPSDD